MSTKTIYKRIALVAVAALGMGVISSVSPANAVTNTYMWCEIADGLPNGSPTDDVCNGVAGVANSISLEFLNAPASSRVTLSGATASIGSTTDADLVIAIGGQSATFSATASNNDGVVTINTPAAGTVTVSLFETLSTGIYKTTATETVTITVNAAAVSGGINTSTSTTFLNKSATVTAATTETTSFIASATANSTATPVFAAIVSLGQTAGAITTSTRVSVSLSGPGTLALSADDTDPLNATIATGRSLTSTINATGEVFTVGVAPDGNPGVTVLTITAGTYTATRTITFSGVVASLAVTAVRGSIPDTADGVLTGDTDGYAAVITGKDAAGNTVTLTAGEFTASTSAELAAAVITNAAVVAATVGPHSGVTVAANAPVLVIDPTSTKTGAKSLTIKHTATGLTVAVPFTVGLVKATTAVLSTDKAVYLPGEKITLTLTLRDAGGFAVADEALGTGLLDAGITANVSLAGDATSSPAVPTVGGKKTWTLYAPLASGPITFAGKTGTGTTAPTTAVTLAATATVSDSASMQALTTLINSLIAKINALSKLVTKIQKKVKA